MLLDIKPLVRDLQGVDLSAASPAVAKAVGGLARLLYPHTDEVRQLLWDVTDLVTEHFASAGTFENRESWLDVLMHFTPRDFLFCDVCDDGQYQALADRQDEVEARWLEDLRPLLDGCPHPFDGLPLMARLRRLQTFFRQDINTLSGGDDERACALLASASSEFERCREDIFSPHSSLIPHNSSLITHNSTLYSLYYFVLCAIRPDQSSPDHVQHYRQFFRDFNDRCRMEQDPDCCWLLREVQWHHRLALDSHDDQTALAGLWLARPESCAAFRRQLYRWHLELDPYDDFSIGEYSHETGYANEGLRRLASWLTAKQKAGIPIPEGRQADIQMSYGLARQIGAYESVLDDYFYLHADEVLSHLEPSKQKTHLKVRMEALITDDQLLAEAREETSAWNRSELTLEDKYLLEDLSHARV